MTIRRGGNPRDDNEFANGRSTMAHRPGEAAPDPGPSRAPRLSARRPGGRSSSERARGRGGGTGGGLLRFGVFLLILAGLVLVVLFTVGRPLVRGVVAGMAGENPSALGIGFVADMVREDLGPALTEPGGIRRDGRDVRRPAGRHRCDHRGPARGRRRPPRRPGVRARLGGTERDDELPVRELRRTADDDARPAGHGASHAAAAAGSRA